jgi:hypoxanthine-DNA glycosylase
MTSTGPAIGFAPIANLDARVLILGSLPSDESLLRHQYFARKTNVFWRLMGQFFDASPDMPYAERCERLKSHGIALWDVCRSAVREGSLDARIDRKTIVPNDFISFFQVHRHIQCLCFAGKTAENLFQTLVLPGLSASMATLPRFALPSTSPAYASMHFEEKAARWKAVLSVYVSIGPSAPR